MDFKTKIKCPKCDKSIEITLAESGRCNPDSCPNCKSPIKYEASAKGIAGNITKRIKGLFK